MSIERLSGGLSPADGSDPRTFPEIFNGFADEFEGKNLPAFSAVAPTDGQVPVFDAVEGVFVPGEGGAGASSLEDLTDTDITSPASDEFLRYDGTDWVNTAANATTSTPGVVLGTTSDGFNTALGLEAFESNTTGYSNTAVGRAALQENTTGNSNTAVGRLALQENTTGIRNTAVGRAAGDLITTGSNNTTLGFAADPSSATASNQVTLGNGSITSLRCNVTSISSLSDVRDKTDIVNTQHGLDTLNKIRPVDFTWARRDGSLGSAPDIGFIAQELASVEDETGDAQRLRFTLRNDPEKLEATPGRLIPILVKAVQELSGKNDELEARIEALEAK